MWPTMDIQYKFWVHNTIGAWTLNVFVVTFVEGVDDMVLPDPMLCVQIFDLLRFILDSMEMNTRAVEI